MPNSDVTPRQQRFLFAKFGAESFEGKKLRREIRSGAVKIRSRIRPGHGIGGGRKRTSARRHRRDLRK